MIRLSNRKCFHSLSHWLWLFLNEHGFWTKSIFCIKQPNQFLQHNEWFDQTKQKQIKKIREINYQKLKNKIGALSTILTTHTEKIDGDGQQASFGRAEGLYFDSSSKVLFITDQGFSSIRKMNQSGLDFLKRN